MLKSIVGTIALGGVVLLVFLVQSEVPVSGALNAYMPVVDGPSVVALPPIGITPRQMLRFNISLTPTRGFLPPLDFFPGDQAGFQGGCSFKVTMFFMTEKRVGIVMPPVLQLRMGDSGHADLDAAVAPMFLDQNGRLQARAMARVEPSDKKCEAVVGSSLEVFDRMTGDTVATSADVSVNPI